MKDISVFFQPSPVLPGPKVEGTPDLLGSGLRIHDNSGFPDLEGIQIAIFGILEERGSVENAGCSGGPDEIRKEIYRLARPEGFPAIADLGNILPGEKISDSLFALSEVVSELLRKSIIPVVIGGSQDLTYGSYLAYQNIEPTINMVSVDRTFDLGSIEESLNANTWVGKMIMHQPNHLFNFSNVGYQTHYVDQKSIDLMSRLFFDSHRLGQIRADMEEVEPVVRNADVVSIDLGCIRMSDFPAHADPAPNGFFGEEICRIARYAGMSDKLSTFGIYELNPRFDVRGQSAKLAAQIIWYFLDGVKGRKRDFPFKNTDDYQKYHVGISYQVSDIIFYKSLRSDRWWMEVPYPPDKRLKVQRHCLVPCSYSDYQQALTDELPDRWWQTFQKLG
jgi:formiminoglutamase